MFEFQMRGPGLDSRGAVALKLIVILFAVGIAYCLYKMSGGYVQAV
ncbi:MAG: hypothetical protein V1834_01065 [Candidatus Micrarchaeota archaeon]